MRPRCCQAKKQALSSDRLTKLRGNSMKHPAPDYPFLAVREALQSLSGASLAMSVIGMVGGAIPIAASWTRPPSAEDWILLLVGWLGHWVMAGLMIYGLIAMLAPVWCFQQLLHGYRSPFRVLAVALISQLLVSTVAVCTNADDGERMRPILISGATILLIIGTSLWTSFITTRRQDTQRAGPMDGSLRVPSRGSRRASTVSSRR
jgi:hypothetical protein